MVDEQRLSDGGGADRASGNPAVAPVVAIEERAAKAEPFEETIEAFRLRVVQKGGRVEEHYVFRKIEQLEEALRAATARAERAEAVLEVFLNTEPPSMERPYDPADFDNWRYVRKTARAALSATEEAARGQD